MLFAHIKWAENTGNNVSWAIRKYEFIRKVLIKDAFTQLKHLASESGKDTFSAIADFNDGVELSKSIFVSTDMFGEKKFQYRPNIGIHNVVVWNGLRHRTLAILAIPEILISPKYTGYIKR